jgi:hypothetical protein
MNKVIIELDKARAERLVELLKERGADDNNFMLKQVETQLQGKCKRSMIEWHEWDERIPEEITEYLPILARWRDPILKAWKYDLSTKYDFYGCPEWAILSKELEK